MAKRQTHIDVNVKTKGNEELILSLVKDKNKPNKQKPIDNIDNNKNDNNKNDNNKNDNNKNDKDLESILSKLNSDNIQESNPGDKSILEYLSTPKTIETILNDNSYDDVETKHIISPENLKSLVNHITNLQKPEWIEIFRIIKNNEPKNYQENNNGIWIVLNKLQKETVIKLHKFVNYCITSKNKLETEKIKISKIKDDLRSVQYKNDEDIIKDSQLLKDDTDNKVPSGFANSSDKVAEINEIENTILKQHIEAEVTKLTNSEVHNLLSERMLIRDRDDETFMVS